MKPPESTTKYSATRLLMLELSILKKIWPLLQLLIHKSSKELSLVSEIERKHQEKDTRVVVILERSKH